MLRRFPPRRWPGTGGYCRVQLRFTRGRVVEVSYAGATEIMGEDDAVCVPIVRNCIDYRAQARGGATRR